MADVSISGRLVISEGPDPLYGVRAWDWGRRYDLGVAVGLALQSTTMRSQRWPLDSCVRATCERIWPDSPPAWHRSPEPRCACGLYAYDPAGATITLWGRSRFQVSGHQGELAASEVAGIVALWGRVVYDEEARLYRAEYARPVAICVGEEAPPLPLPRGLSLLVVAMQSGNVVTEDHVWRLVRLSEAGRTGWIAYEEVLA